MAQESKQEPFAPRRVENLSRLDDLEEPLAPEALEGEGEGEELVLQEGPPPDGTPEGVPVEEGPPKKGGRLRSLSTWVEQRATSVVSKIYETRADDLEERARRVVGTAYQEKADDLQLRAQQALQQAIADQAEIIKQAIEHGVEVKKREVRWSLLVLVAGSLIYLVLYWLTYQPPVVAP